MVINNFIHQGIILRNNLNADGLLISRIMKMLSPAKYLRRYANGIANMRGFEHSRKNSSGRWRCYGRATQSNANNENNGCIVWATGTEQLVNLLQFPRLIEKIGCCPADHRAGQWPANGMDIEGIEKLFQAASCYLFIPPPVPRDRVTSGEDRCEASPRLPTLIVTNAEPLGNSVSPCHHRAEPIQYLHQRRFGWNDSPMMEQNPACIRSSMAGWWRA